MNTGFKKIKFILRKASRAEKGIVFRYITENAQGQSQSGHQIANHTMRLSNLINLLEIK